MKKSLYRGAADREKCKFELADQGGLFSTKSVIYRWRCSPSYCGHWRKRSSSGSAETGAAFRFRLSRPATRIWKPSQGTKFQGHLFYRLNVIPVCIPPLRERGSDVLLIARHFIEKITEVANKDPLALTDGAEELLLNHSWPGNVRELNNVIERTSTCERGADRPTHLPFYLFQNKIKPGPPSAHFLKTWWQKQRKPPF